MGREQALTLALYALKEEVAHAWKQAMEGREPDLVALQRSWDQVIKEVMKGDRNR